jgi:hypothetical protein
MVKEHLGQSVCIVRVKVSHTAIAMHRNSFRRLATEASMASRPASDAFAWRAPKSTTAEQSPSTSEV